VHQRQPIIILQNLQKRIKPIPPRRMNWHTPRFLNHQRFTVITGESTVVEDFDWARDDGGFVTVEDVGD
jgi:hypothetical protein